MSSAFLAAVLCLLSLASSDAFITGGTRLTMRTSTSRLGAASVMSAEPQTRKSLLQQGVLGIASLAVLSQPQRASAGLFQSDESKWAGVLDPKAAVKDVSKLSSDTVKKSLEAINSYRTATKDISDILEKDPQADVLPKIKEIFGFAEFRKVLNDVNGVFDEDTQRGTDLIVRNMLQDALELANAAKLKPDVPRSERKTEILRKKLQKLEQAYENLNAYL
ncbi:unnamed protein product [Ascophyllum nodosum]